MLEKLAHTFLIPPGEHLRNWMDDERIGVAEFARRIGVSTQTVQNILAGNQAITPEMAYHLRLATGVSASFWTNLEANYQIEKLRCVKAEEEARIKDWLQSFPLIDLLVVIVVCDVFVIGDHRSCSWGDKLGRERF